MFYVLYRTLKGHGLPGSSVVFRQGTNVEVGLPSFMASGEGANGVSLRRTCMFDTKVFLVIPHVFIDH